MIVQQLHIILAHGQRAWVLTHLATADVLARLAAGLSAGAARLPCLAFGAALAAFPVPALLGLRLTFLVQHKGLMHESVCPYWAAI